MSGFFAFLCLLYIIYYIIRDRLGLSERRQMAAKEHGKGENTVDEYYLACEYYKKYLPDYVAFLKEKLEKMPPYWSGWRNYYKNELELVNIGIAEMKDGKWVTSQNPFSSISSIITGSDFDNDDKMFQTYCDFQYYRYGKEFLEKILFDFDPDFYKNNHFAEKNKETSVASLQQVCEYMAAQKVWDDGYIPARYCAGRYERPNFLLSACIPKSYPAKIKTVPDDIEPFRKWLV